MAEELVALNPGTRLADTWTITRKLGAGMFGAVYLCRNDQALEAAMKTEPVDTKHPLLLMEATVLRSLDTIRDGDGKHFCHCLDLGSGATKDPATGLPKDSVYRVILHLATPRNTMAEELVALNPGTRLADTWTITRKLGAGMFGAVYLCRNDQALEAAMKTEPVDTKHPLLLMEATVLRSLDTIRDGDGKHFCHCLDLGSGATKDPATGLPKEFRFIVMSLVGRGIDDLVREAGGHFSPGTAIGVSIQLLNALRGMHDKGFLHRDIKPPNATIGRPESNELRLIYLIDFGMARKYQKDDGSHRRPREATKFRGSAKYASISAHMRREYSRKDDIESWFYVLVELFKGALPWAKIGQMKLRRLDERQEVRQQAIMELLEGCPTEFAAMLKHIDDLTFEERPDYETLLVILRYSLAYNRFQEHPYDWEVGRRFGDRQVQSAGANVQRDRGEIAFVFGNFPRNFPGNDGDNALRKTWREKGIAI
uniref:Protein kinase domain-containing protein n=1 Tax=Globodera pallida TaxID=36090 RepID=A0A183BS02_GLOPA